MFLLISRYCGSAGSSEVIAALANPDLGALDGTASSLSAGLNSGLGRGSSVPAIPALASRSRNTPFGCLRCHCTFSVCTMVPCIVRHLYTLLYICWYPSIRTGSDLTDLPQPLSRLSSSGTKAYPAEPNGTSLSSLGGLPTFSSYGDTDFPRAVR